MRTSNIKTIVGSALIALFTSSAFAQAPMKSVEDGGKRPTQLDTANVPAEVRKVYIKEYPASIYQTWYGYPEYSTEFDWFEYNPYLMPDPAAVQYYIVAFEQDSVPQKVFYDKSAKKIVTHKRTANLPKEVTDALKKSTYKDWTVTKEKEEILRHSDKKKVYKIVVEKGTQKHALFYRSDGVLIKDKTVGPQNK
jgi:hypothetical protein